MPMIGNWKCTELYGGTLREATLGDVSVIADVDGIEVDESWSGYDGGSGCYTIPANVLMWLVDAVRGHEAPPPPSSDDSEGAGR